MKLNTDLNVFIYSYNIYPEVINDTYTTYKIVNTCKERLQRIIGLYVISGFNLYSPVELQDSIVIKTTYKDQSYEITIDVDQKRLISGNEINEAPVQDSTLMNNLVNIILKEAIRGANLQQIGRGGRFFDLSNPYKVA